MKNGKIWVGITDFGLSEILEEPSSDAHLLGSFRGTLNYAAPEVLALRRKGKRPPSPPIDPAMDMFSFGLVLLELFHGKGSLIIITTDTNQKIRGFSTIRSSLDRKNPTDAIILDLIDNTPSNRPTAEATLRRLQALPC